MDLQTARTIWTDTYTCDELHPPLTRLEAVAVLDRNGGPLEGQRYFVPIVSYYIGIGLISPAGEVNYAAISADEAEGLK